MIGFAAATILIVINFAIAIKVGSSFEDMLKHKDKRVTLTQDVLRGMKQIKCLNWEKYFIGKLMQHRERELKGLTRIKYLDAISSHFWVTTATIISVVTFLAYQYLSTVDTASMNTVSLTKTLIEPLLLFLF
jgi:ATP-binding cassette subfamily C (CFTR/MRP) protein 10